MLTARNARVDGTATSGAISAATASLTPSHAGTIETTEPATSETANAQSSVNDTASPSDASAQYILSSPTAVPADFASSTITTSDHERPSRNNAIAHPALVM